MKTRMLCTALAALLLCSVVTTVSAEEQESKGFTITGHFGVFSMDGTGTAKPGAWDNHRNDIPFDVTNSASSNLVRQEPAVRLGFGWESRSLAVFGMTAGYRFSHKLHLRLGAEWANKEDAPEYYYGEPVPVGGSVYPPNGHEYLDRVYWNQASLSFFVDYVPFEKYRNVYIIAGAIYSQFQLELSFTTEDFTNDVYTTETRNYDDVGAALGYTVGTGLLFAQKPGVREGYVELTWTSMKYGSDLSLSGNASLFGRKVELEIGGFRFTTGFRFYLNGLI